MRDRDDSRDSTIAKEYSKKSSFARHAQSPSSIGQSAFGEGAESPSRTGVTREARVLPNPRKSVLARRQSPSSPRRVFDRTGIVNSSRASGSRKSVSASSRKSEADCRDQAGGPRSPEEDPAATTGSGRASRIEKDFRHRKSTTSISYTRRVTVERASLQKSSTTGRMSQLPTEINLHHDRFLAEVIAPFDHLPAKFAVEPFG